MLRPRFSSAGTILFQTQRRKELGKTVERQKPVDVVIVGAGWSGLLMAKEIANRTSLNVLVLERGGQPRRASEAASTMDELDYLIRLRQMQNLADETMTHRHSIKDGAVPVRQLGSFLPGTGVGGAGEHWGGVANRYRPEQFRLASHLREKYRSEQLPENLAVQDWGVTYDEIEPYYWKAEQMLGVSGKAGNLQGKLIEGGDIFEGPRSHEFPTPPAKTPYKSELFRKAALDLGYHPYPGQTVTLSQAYTNPDGITRPACTYCGYCSRFSCMIGSKAQPSNTLLPLLANKKNFQIQSGCSVRRIVHRNGKAEGVTYVDTSGQERLQPADVVILSSWTMNNTRILLLSKIGEPYNPETGRGTLGKNLTHQVNHNLELFFDKPLNAFMGSGGVGIAIGDFAGDVPEDDTFAGVLRGGAIRGFAPGEPGIASFGKIPPGEVKPNWGSDWKKAALKWHDRAGDLTCEASHPAYKQNFLDLDPTYTDKYGDPLLRMTLDWTDHERRQREALGKIQASIAKAMGARIGNYAHSADSRYSVTYYQSTHVQGGVVTGSTPENSVVNTWLQHWNISNLWIIGGSNFPQNDSANPTLTILAMIFRAADVFVDRYIKKPGALA
jgi:gluconate 2-dehydrogenase alpha chain